MLKSWLLLSALLLAGCGKELGRVPFSGESTRSAAIVLRAGRVAFWTDIDIAFNGSATLQYRVALMQGGTRVATALCDAFGPMSTKLRWVEVDYGSTHSRSGQGKMACSVTLPKGGPTTVEASLAFGVRPLSATISRADLVVKQ